MYSKGDRILGKYEIIDAMKPGSFGAVYRVHNFGVGRESVIKIVPATDPAYIKEIIESYAQHSCKHDKIVTILACEIIDYIMPTGLVSPAIAMELEWIPGGTWGGALTNGYLPLHQSCQYASDVLYGLHFAHSNDVIHGDVKPDNIFITPQGAKLADFGLSKLTALPGPNRAQELFYVTHGAPEQHRSTDIDRQTDVFAAGMTLFRAVNNIHDWHDRVDAVRNKDEAMQEGVLKDKIGYAPEVPRKIRGIINRACNKDRNVRFKTCAEFRKALSGLRFNAFWFRNGDTFTSTQSGRTEEITVIARKSNYEVEFKLNSRRVNAKCAGFANLNEALAFQARYLYDNTVA